MIKIIPTPKEYSLSSERVLIPLTYRCDKDEEVILSFLDYADRIHGVIFGKTQAEEAGIDIVIDDTMVKEAYQIDVKKEGKVYLSAQNAQALSYAFASLLLIMEKTEEGLSAPVMKISDFPEGKVSWRGLMIDLGRKWHPLKYILDAIDVCWLYKINRLQLHFSEYHSIAANAPTKILYFPVPTPAPGTSFLLDIPAQKSILNLN